LFKKTSAAFDEGGAKGLLLNHLNVYNECEIIFDSNDAVENKKVEKDVDDEMISLAELIPDSKLFNTNLEKFDICTTFSHFAFTNLDNTKPSDQVMLIDEDDDQFNLDAGAPFPNESDDDDKELEMIKEIESQEHDDKDEDNPPPGQPQANPLREELQLVGNALTEKENEFGYYDAELLKKWSDKPDHWKYKPAAKKKKLGTVNFNRGSSGVLNASQENDEALSKRRKKKTFYLNFEDDSEIALSAGKSSTTLSTNFLEKASETATTLPNNDTPDYNVKEFTKLFNKPYFVIPTQKPVLTGQPKENPPLIDETGQPLPINLEDADADDNPSGMGGFDINNSFDDDDAFAPAPVLDGMSIIEEPKKVDKIQINYSKVAKKIDVKALKDALWDKLCNTEPQQKIKKMSTTKSFQDVLTELPNNLNDEMASEISVPFCFICLLHLANEQGLKLTQDGKLDELYIEQSK